MKVMVGSRNAAKMGAARQGVAAYWDDAQIEGADVDSGVPAQPIGLDQTMQGALNRARAAQALGADLGVGMEGGVAQFNGEWAMIGFVAVSDGKREVAVITAATPMPYSWGEAMKNGAELRPYVLAAGLPYDYATGVVGTLSNGKVRRDDSFALAVKTALIPWVNPGAFEDTSDQAKAG
ncbi:MAG: DUF84 family protein [Proteobacteria bacterium]|nr:DUF84 family protein [Pseudomonadota bacterium]